MERFGETKSRKIGEGELVEKKESKDDQDQEQDTSCPHYLNLALNCS